MNRLMMIAKSYTSCFLPDNKRWKLERSAWFHVTGMMIPYYLSNPPSTSSNTLLPYKLVIIIISSAYPCLRQLKRSKSGRCYSRIY